MDQRFSVSNNIGKIKWIFLLIFVFSALFSCKKDEEEKPLPNPDLPYIPYNPTPFNLKIPDHFSIIFPPSTPPDNPLTEEGVFLGKKLFFEKKLSKDNSLSCAGCHKPEFAFNDKGNALSQGVDGQLGIRNAMPLFNLAWVPSFDSRFNWHGSVRSLEKQALEPVRNPLEMMESWENVSQKLRNDPQYPPLFYAAFGSPVIDSNQIVKAIAQFERTLISGDSRMDKYVQEQLGLNPPGGPFLTAQEIRGFNVYTSTDKGDCFHCHGNLNLRNPLWTDNEFRNNGLDLNPDSGLAAVTGLASDLGKFKTPSLRNLVFTAPYMHDGRFQTLEEVVDFYSTGVEANSPNISPLMFDRGSHIANLTDQEKEDLVALLKAITDNSFVNNPEFRP